MKKVILSLAVFQSLYASGSACCGGAGPKSFISLQQLQSYEVGVSTSLRDIYGRYNVYGELAESGKNQTYVVSVGAGARINSDLETFVIVPVAHQLSAFSSDAATRTGLGDILFGGRYYLIHSLFLDDWYPTISVSVGLKTPSGSLEQVTLGRRIPGTGNGIWEPYFGLGLKKEYGFVTLLLDVTYTTRLNRGGTGFVEEGDKIDLTESATFPFSRQFSAGLGSTQTWTTPKSLNGSEISDSSGRAINGFVSATYFFNQWWSIVAGLDASIPIEGFGVNQQMSRTVSLTTKYGFY